MKKTLLTIALASCAVSALATTTFYTGENGIDNFTVAGKVGVQVNSQTTLNSVDKAARTKYEIKDESSRINQYGYDLMLATGGYLQYSEGLNLGYYIKSNPSYTHNFNARSDVSALDFQANDVYGFIGYNKIGALTFGHTDTFASGTGSDLNTLGVETADSALGVVTKPDYTIKLESADFAGFKAGYSFGRDLTVNNIYTYQNALALSYEFAGFSVNAYGQMTNHKSISQVVDEKIKTHMLDRTFSGELAVSNDSLVDGLSFTIAGDFAHSIPYNAAGKALKTTTTAFSFLAKASYTYNQYIQPYAGFVYLMKIQKNTQEADNFGLIFENTKDVTYTGYNSIHQVYVGINSDIAKYKYSTLSTYLEANFAYDKVYISSKGFKDATVLGHTTSYGIAFGASLGF